MRRFTIAAALLIAAATAFADEPFRRARENALSVLPSVQGKTVFIGNSITNMHEWREAFADSNVVNRGVSGGMSYEVSDNLESYIAGGPAKVFLMIGTNDITGTPAANVKKIIQRIRKESPSTTLYVQSILPSRSGARTKQNITAANADVKAFIDGLKDEKVQFVDLYTPMATADGDMKGDYHCGDNLHPAPQGYSVWCRQIQDKVGRNTIYPETVAVNRVGSWQNAYNGRAAQFANYPVAATDIFMIGDNTIHTGEWGELLGNANVKSRGTGWGYPGCDIGTITIEAEHIFHGDVKPAKAFLYVGTQNINNNQGAIESHKAEYKTLVEKIKTLAPTTKLYLMGLLPGSNATRNAVYKQFNDAAKAIADTDTADNVEYVDTYTPFLNGQVANTKYIKGEYLYGVGFAKMAEELAKVIDGCTPVTEAQAEATLARNTARCTLGKAVNKALDIREGDDAGEYLPENLAALKAAMEAAYTALQNIDTPADTLARLKTNIETEMGKLVTNMPKTDGDWQENWYTISSPLRGNRYMTADEEDYPILGGPDTRYTRTMWKFIKRTDDKGWDIINRADGSYISPVAAYDKPVTTTTVQPENGWTVQTANTPGLFIISSGKVQLNQTNFTDFPIYNWSAGESGNDKGDAGCQFAITAAPDTIDAPDFNGGVPVYTAANITTGWYTIQYASNVNFANYAEDALKGCFLFNNEREAKQNDKNFYPVGIETSPGNSVGPKGFFRIEAKGGKYYLRSSNGHYIKADATAATAEDATPLSYDESTHSFHIGSHWLHFNIDNQLVMGKSSGTGAANRFHIYKTPLERQNLEAWTVSITGAPAAAELRDAPKVTLENSVGLKSVYDGGTFIVERNTDMEGETIQAPDFDGLVKNISHNADNKTITVEYTANDPSAAIAQANALLALDGVGYPAADATERTALKNAVEAAKPDVAAINKAMEAYKVATNVKLPENGKAYTFTNVQANGKRYYLDNTASGVALVERTADTKLPESAVFVCSKVYGGYVFATHNGKYFIFKGSSAGADGNDGHMDNYDDTQCRLTIAKMPLNGQYTSKASSLADLFGYCTVKGKRSNGQDGMFIIKNGGTYDQANAPFYNDNYSAAFLIEETPYYNTVTTEQMGGACYSSLYLPFPVMIPGDVSLFACKFSEDGNAFEFEPVSGNVLAKEQAVVVSTAEPGSYSFSPAFIPGDSIIGNVLLGTVEDKPARDDLNTLYLAEVDGKPGFYAATLTRAAGNLQKGVAYYESKDKEAIEIINIVTGISAAAKAAKADGAVYDLQGRKVERAEKGLYIIGGRKVVVK